VNEMVPQPRPVPLDQARQGVIAQLCAHYAVDTLTAEALEERLDRAHAATSVQELQALTADLPAAPPAGAVAPPRTWPAPATAAALQIVAAVMGGAERKGAWTPPRTLYVTAVMGGADIDLREARLSSGVTEVVVFAFMGGVEIVVPPHVHVDVSGLALMGGFGQVGRSEPPDDPATPVIRVTGVALMGGVDVSVRYPGERPRDARRREKLRDEERRRLGR
jgi:hypothetical protein